MALTQPPKGTSRTQAGASPIRNVGPALVFGLCVALVGITVVLSRTTLSHDLFAPVLVTVLFALAMAVSVAAWMSRPAAAGQLSYWDVAGGLVFIGIGLSLLIDPDQMMRLVDGTDRRP